MVNGYDRFVQFREEDDESDEQPRHGTGRPDRRGHAAAMRGPKNSSCMRLAELRCMVSSETYDRAKVQTAYIVDKNHVRYLRAQ